MSRATLLTTAQTVIQSYNAWDPTSILSYRAPHCEHQFLPTSLNQPPLNNAQYAAYFAPLMPHFRSFTVTVHDTVIDEVARKVVMRASSTAETDIGPYANEYVIVLRMTEDGRLVERFDEFNDSAFIRGFLPRLRETMGV